ncbi:MAG: translation initiation factor IF-2 [Thermobacillus sp. ZCTH02-B1]|uniref:translation initiation factor IF-2 n=1 Tax=Thermobacillus sp. ZCTH02-B1 TaxID=1858795 RepID=UPI000B563B37|nr:translation initiation factor IF-2 [Thermobacillus sp. ZCTH02-B1]OUM96938.1 MAG: translation initiation factor IF-2 [Thermobacillus sp. ZCTH02-B1]
MSKQENKQENKEKLRIYEYAKQQNMSSKEILTILRRLGVQVNNHMSVMEDHMVEMVEGFFRSIKENAAAKRAQELQAAQQQRQAAKAQEAARQQAAQVAGRTAPAGAAQQQAGAARAQSGQAGRAQQQAQGGKQQPAQGGQANRQQQAGQGERRGDRPQGGQGGQGGRQHGGARAQQGAQGGRQQPRGQGERRGDRPQGGKGPGGFRGGAGGGFRGAALAPAAPPQPDRKKGGGKDKDRDRRNKNEDSRKYEERTVKLAPGKSAKKNQERREKVDNTPKKIIVRGEMTVGELAKLLHKDVSDVIKKLMFLGVLATINQVLDLDAIQLVASEYGVEVEIKLPVDEDAFEKIEEQDDPADLKPRPPVVTIMGHVDHGKTTLLDAIRHTNVTSGEAGGITQHIGAYQVEVNGKKITFLDTPGHEAFTTMRARGAQVTDITVLVVAADDGVMPQTVEAINHAKAANVPIIVAVNKIDKPEANPDRVMQELTEYGLVPEAWGGDTIYVNISAKQRINLDELLEMILLVAEVNDYKANPDKRARGTVIEAELDKGKGPVATVLVQHGTLRVGDALVAGNCFGRVRAMVNDRGRRLKEAGPSTPVEITGLNAVPQAGDPFMVFEDERKARAIAERRAAKARESERNATARVTLDDLYKQIKEGEIKELHVIIKADVQGSVEALKGALLKIDVEGVRVKIIHAAVGAITESDVALASASNAIIIGFNVRPEPQAKATAEQERVDIRLHNIIYNVTDEIEQAMKGMLDPVVREVVIGHAEVRNVFRVSKVGTIAGCMVTSGKVTRSAEARLIRDGIVVHQGKITSLKRFKDDVREVTQGYECGLIIDGAIDVREGDMIEAFVMETVER